MTSASDRARVQSGLRGELRLFGHASPGARLVELPGVLACVVPATPQRSLFNAVVYEQARDLLAAWPTLDGLYAEAGVSAWTVWLRPDDVTAASELARRGHRLDGRPAGMVAALHEVSLVAEGDLDWTCGRDYHALAALNEASYSFDSPAFGAAFALPPASESVRIYVARVAGESACTLCVHDEPDGTLGVSAVATLPAARGRGLASRLLSIALSEAREQGRTRGVTHTALVASSAGLRVYARLGYREAGVREMWEKREQTEQREQAVRSREP